MTAASVDAAPIDAARPVAPPLRLGTKLAFGVGSAAESLALYTVTSFALIFYNQVLGVPAHLAGLAISASLVFDGITDPIIGSLSDRTRSRLGRRHPYMFAAPIPIAACLFAIFNPPVDRLSDSGLLVWFGAAIILLRQSMTFFHTPHLALGGELSTDYAGRSTVMAHATFFGWVGGALTWWLALGFFFPTTPDYPRGILNPEPWPRYAATLSIAVVVILFASSWFTRDRIPFLPKPSAGTPRFSPREFARDLVRALTNRNYLWLLIAYLFLALMGGLRDGLWIYTATFYWNLTSEQLSWFIVGSFFGYVFSFFATSRLHGRFDKRASIVSSALASTIVGSLPLLLALLGVLSPSTPGIVPILIGFNGVTYVAISMLTISVMSALADVADENELKHGVRQEGVRYSTRALAAKLDTALGTALAGAVLTFIAFPERAEPGAVPDVILRNLSVAYVLTALPGLVAVYFYSRFGITRTRYEEMQAALARRRTT